MDRTEPPVPAEKPGLLARLIGIAGANRVLVLLLSLALAVAGLFDDRAGGLVIGLLLFPPAGALLAVVAAGGGKCWYDEKNK